MTALERQALAEGFLILLLRTCSEPQRNVLTYRAELFDGGRLTRSAAGCLPFLNPPDGTALQPLRDLLRNVRPAPHVLAGLGRGWRDLILQCYPNLQDEFRILDLQVAAAVLVGTSVRTPPDQLAGALGLGLTVAEGTPLAGLPEDLLWAVLNRAGERGLDWPGLLGLNAAPTATVPFEKYTFARETIATLPDRPGVYIMRDAAGSALYVGKAASLARRVADYFRATADIPPKLQYLRETVRSLDWQPVGSELEALLLENRRIGELLPTVNTQRTIVPGTSRYQPNPSPVAVLCASVQPARCEVFLFGGACREALQVRLDPARPPLRLLEDLIGFLCAVRPRRPARKARMTVWDAAGVEICHRYWSRAHDRLHWLDLGVGNGPAAAATDLAAALRTTRVDTEPAEFRLDL